MYDKLEELRHHVDAVYNEINRAQVRDYTNMLDYLYPRHDGELDAEAVGELIYLRLSIRSLARACDFYDRTLSGLIHDYDVSHDEEDML